MPEKEKMAVVAEVGEMAVVLVEWKVAMIFIARLNVFDFCRLIGLYNIYHVDLIF